MVVRRLYLLFEDNRIILRLLEFRFIHPPAENIKIDLITADDRHYISDYGITVTIANFMVDQ